MKPAAMRMFMYSLVWCTLSTLPCKLHTPQPSVFNSTHLISKLMKPVVAADLPVCGLRDIHWSRGSVAAPPPSLLAVHRAHTCVRRGHCMRYGLLRAEVFVCLQRQLRFPGEEVCATEQFFAQHTCSSALHRRG